MSTTHLFFSLLFCIHLLLLPLPASSRHLPAAAATAAATGMSTAVVLTGCAGARFRGLCVQTLAPALPRTPTELARAATSLCLAGAQNATAFLRSLPAPPLRRDRAALRDCVTLVASTVGQLSRTAIELGRLRPGTLSLQLENARTWLSAAMTNQDMCLAGFRDAPGPTSGAVAAKVSQLWQMTSNALYLITRLGGSSSRHHRRACATGNNC